tara:strand:+ start:343 stop:588 length:246 start_codon:yes stop_codon:yes gene_type:complete
MSILKKLEKQGSQLSGLNGQTPETPNFATSTLHDEYSLNDSPVAAAVRPRNGVLPKPTNLAPQQDQVQYVQNLPEAGEIRS